MEKGGDQKWKKAQARCRKGTVGRQAKIENFHPTDTVLEEEGGKKRSRSGKDGGNNGDKRAEKLLCSNPHTRFQHNVTFTCVQVVLTFH
jgi:hypothetical protein